MGILTKEVKIKPSGTAVRYYKDKGYDAKWHEPLIVKVSDLPVGSKVEVEVLCDYCQKNIITTPYKHYHTRTKKISKYACIECASLKRRESNLLRYNVENVNQLDSVRNKTILTNIERYGVDNPSQNKDVRKKMEVTSILRYGVKNPMQSPEIKMKAIETLCKNGTYRTSKQQIYLHSIFGGEINYPIKYYAADICLVEENLVIEYDGGGHKLREVFGELTQEEFSKKELIRNKIIKREGYKQMRIISENDKLPSDTILLQMLQDAHTYFSLYPQHSWIEFNIGTSTIRNSENPEGSPYNFGVLRTIKDSDLNAKQII